MSSLLLLLLTSAFAQDPAYDGTKDTVEEAEKPLTKLSAELGAAFTSGNAFSLAGSGALKGSHAWKSNQFTFGFGVNLNFVRLDEDGDGTVADENGPLQIASERITGGLRYDRFFGERNALFVSANEERDRLAGLLWRFNEQIGYRRVLVANDKTDLDFEIGLAYTQENLATSTSDDGTVSNGAILDNQFLAARVFLGFEHRFNEAVAIGDDLEFFQNLTGFNTIGVDARINNTFYISAKLSDRFGLKITHRLAFDNAPAGEEFAKLDQTTMLNLVATIF
jgi:putative salt-induced outer membrane protein YdiY